MVTETKTFAFEWISGWINVIYITWCSDSSVDYHLVVFHAWKIIQILLYFIVEHMDHCGAMKTFHQRTKPQRAQGSWQISCDMLCLFLKNPSQVTRMQTHTRALPLYSFMFVSSRLPLIGQISTWSSSSVTWPCRPLCVVLHATTPDALSRCSEPSVSPYAPTPSPTCCRGLSKWWVNMEKKYRLVSLSLLEIPHRKLSRTTCGENDFYYFHRATWWNYY